MSMSTMRTKDHIWKTKWQVVPSYWVTWTQTDVRGTMRVIIMFCQHDSVSLLSFSPQPLTERLRQLDEFRHTALHVLSINFIFFSRRALTRLLWLSFSVFCLLFFFSLQYLSAFPLPLSPLSWWFIAFFYSTCCYVWQTETSENWNVIWGHSYSNVHQTK